MSDKISKLRNVIKKYGFAATFTKGCQYLMANYISKINIFAFWHILLNKGKYESEMKDILSKSGQSAYDRIIIWRSDFGYQVPLFQRPQHIMRNLAKEKSLVFYEVTRFTDNVDFIKKIEDNFYLINLSNPLFRKMIYREIEATTVPRYVDIYSTNWKTNPAELRDFVNRGYEIIYEYIDDLSPLLSGTKDLPVNIERNYEYALAEKDKVYIVVTADALYEDIKAKRGEEKLIYASNGVDYEHFQIESKTQPQTIKDEKWEEIVADKKPVIGYYGALASWFDFESIKTLAAERPGYEIVLLGIRYDDTVRMEDLESMKNIHFLGPKSYEVLPWYAARMNVLTIPFILNSITEATSPLKLFEYMALGKPVVTSAMRECRKYKSVLLYQDKYDFVRQVDKAVSLQEDAVYRELLKEEALENTWEKKAKSIIEGIK